MKKFLIGIVACLFISTSISMQSCSQNIEEVKIKTSAQCDMCKTKIEENLMYEKGVKNVEVDLTANIVTVKYKADKTDADKIRTALSKIGYDADSIPAVKEAYDSLPPCCQKPK